MVRFDLLFLMAFDILVQDWQLICGVWDVF